MIAAIVVLQIVLLLITFVFLRNKPGSGGTGASFVPIWIAVFIPFLARKNKSKDPGIQEKILWIALGLAVLVLLGIVFVLLRSI